MEFVVTVTLKNGEVVRGIQKAYYGHSAIDFFIKDNNLDSKSAHAEKKINFEKFLAKGLRQALQSSKLVL